MSDTANNLAYYLDRSPTADEVIEADEWQQDNPGSSLSEWVDAMLEIGAL
jgi:hypothetical protein